MNKDKETPVTYSEVDSPMTTHSEVPLLALIEHTDYGHGPPKNDRDNIKKVESQSIKTDTTIPYQLASEINWLVTKIIDMYIWHCCIRTASIIVTVI